MQVSENPLPPLPRRRTAFRPRFTLTLLYLAGFFLLFALLLALPDLLEGASQLPPGPEQLTDEELARAEQIGRRALGGGKLLGALLLSVIAVGLGVYRDLLPGMRE